MTKIKVLQVRYYLIMKDFHGGDDCEGTYLSNVDPRCHIIYDSLVQVPFSFGILGNHDLSYIQQTEYLQQLLQNDNVHGGWISTNIFNSTTNKPFQDQYKLIKTKQGMNILSFGYMYTSMNDYGNLYVSSLEDSSEQIQIEDIINPYDIDLLILMCHIGYETPSLHEIYQYWRQRFQNDYNYTVPILLIGAHDHLQVNTHCEYLGHKDTQCWLIDDGKYFQNLNQLDIQCDKEEIQFNSQQYNVSSCTFKQDYDNKTFTYDNIASRFNLKPINFDTKNGRKLNMQINQYAEEYQVNKPTAYAKFKYYHSQPVTQQSSLQYQYNFPLFDSLINNDQMKQQTNCTQFPVTRTAITRDDIQKGIQTLETLTNSMPFSYEIQVIQNLTQKQAKCVFDYLNTGLWEFNISNQETLEKLADIVEKLNPVDQSFYTARNESWDQKCYDFIMNSYEVPRAMLAYDICNISQDFVLDKIYQTSSGIQFTDQLFQTYWQRYFTQIQFDQNSTDDYQSITEYESIANIVLYVIFMICIVILDIKIRKQNNGYSRLEDVEQ